MHVGYNLVRQFNKENQMSDKMRSVPFGSLLERLACELRNQKSVFSIPYSSFYHDSGEKKVRVFSQEASNGLGPAAGPHTQLAQNIISAYLAGARFIELKTVQIMDQLEIDKPCIDARDEGYNVEWSTEFTLPKAYDEYLKAWIIVHILDMAMTEDWKSPSFIFNMSVGYNLEGIKKERLQNAARTAGSGDEIHLASGLLSVCIRVAAISHSFIGRQVNHQYGQIPYVTSAELPAPTPGQAFHLQLKSFVKGRDNLFTVPLPIKEVYQMRGRLRQRAGSIGQSLANGKLISGLVQLSPVSQALQKPVPFPEQGLSVF